MPDASRVGRIADRLAVAVRDLVVPPLCLGCGDPQLDGTDLCRECRSRLRPLRGARCRKCGSEAVSDLLTCRECRDRDLVFESAWSAFAYEGVARRLVQALKSGRVVAAGHLMAQSLASAPFEVERSTTVVPVPTHRRRRLASGLNPAAALAREFAILRRVQVAQPLARRAAARQTGLDRHRRIENAKASVVVTGHDPPTDVILVDDVYTTGATLDACARALLQAGAVRVRALTFARTGRQRLEQSGN